MVPRWPYKCFNWALNGHADREYQSLLIRKMLSFRKQMIDKPWLKVELKPSAVVRVPQEITI